MNEVTILKQARQLISNPEAWTQKRAARDAEGKAVHWSCSSAVSFCAIGAINRTVVLLHPEGGRRDDAAWRVIDGAHNYLQKATPSVSVALYNDEHTHEEVLAMFDKAIALAKV